MTAVGRGRGGRRSIRWTRRFAAAVSLVLATGAGASSDRDLSVDLEMGVLDPDPLLDRILTEAPEPWPGPRGEQPFDQQPPRVQEAPPPAKPPEKPTGEPNSS